jgi:hypothetical protein
LPRQGFLLNLLVTASWEFPNAAAKTIALFMIEHAPPQGKHQIPLSLAAGQRFVTPHSEPVLGWLGRAGTGVAQALSLPAGLLDPRAAENICYSCNLPAPTAKTAMPPSGTITAVDGKISRSAWAAFLEASLPGGQVLAIMPDGGAGVIRFRWMCLSRQSRETSWRCFVQLRDSAWTTAGHDYAFDAGGFLVTSPGKLTITLGSHRLTLQHPEGMLTCFPCKSGRVKITQLRADGWRKRDLISLSLHSDRNISARFSDGTQTIIATAAPAHAATPVAA